MVVYVCQLIMIVCNALKVTFLIMITKYVHRVFLNVRRAHPDIAVRHVKIVLLVAYVLVLNQIIGLI